MRIIALTGQARSGKGHAARLLYKVVPQRELDPRGWRPGIAPRTVPAEPVQLVGFADGLRAACEALWPEHDWFDDPTKLALVGDVTGRAVLERVGALVRELDPRVFIRYAERRINHQAGWVVFTDLRLAPEARWVREQGGIVVQTLRQPVGPNGGDPANPTQQPLPFELIDYQLDNAGDDSATAGHWRIILRDRGWM